jgi:Putative peptidoglycan binding domain
MNKILIWTGALAFAGATAWGQNNVQSNNEITPTDVHRKASTVQKVAPITRGSTVTNRQLPMTRRSISRAPLRQPTNVTVDRERNMSGNRNRSAMVNRSQNAVINRNQNVAINRNQARISFNQAVNLHRDEFHDRDWWRRHFQIVIINSNAFFFDAGFWFPAWGYFPGAYYPYDGPIYGYNGLAPDQVVVNVQVQLQRDGYYAGPIDGVLGPVTRNAIAAFQADHGLAVTAAIDRETVSTLGLA